MRGLRLTREIVDAIERYRAVADSEPTPENLAEYRQATNALAEIVRKSYDESMAADVLLQPYQRSVLVGAWREHRRAVLLARRNGEAEPARVPVHGKTPTMLALERLGMLDADPANLRSGFLTPVGEKVARKAWEDAGSVEAGEPV